MNFPSEATEDCRLVQLTADGDAQAFTELYDRHSTLVFSVALKILADRDEARDVLQQVFLKLFKKASLYNPDKGKPAAWLAAMTRNQSLDRIRQIKARRSLDETLYQEAAAENLHLTERYAADSDEVGLLHGAMAALRPDEIHVLHLAYFGGLTQSEISEKVGKPLGSVKALIRRALLKLRSSLDGMIQPDSLPPHYPLSRDTPSRRKTIHALRKPKQMSKKSVFCISNCRNSAEMIVDQLKFHGISNRDISVLYPDVEKNGPKSHHFVVDPDNAATAGVLAGAGTGAAIGGTLGWIVGIGALAVPGVGTFIAAGPIIASLSGAAVGAAVGGIAGGLIALGLPESQARHCEYRIRLGNILISVHTENPAEAMQAKFIFTRGRAQDICLIEEVFVPPWRGTAGQPPQRAAFACNSLLT